LATAIRFLLGKNRKGIPVYFKLLIIIIAFAVIIASSCLYANYALKSHLQNDTTAEHIDKIITRMALLLASLGITLITA
jgi:hypothetical protein